MVLQSVKDQNRRGKSVGVGREVSTQHYDRPQTFLKLDDTSSKKMESWLPRWRSALEQFDFELIYNPGNKHVISEAWTCMNKAT